MSQTTQSEPKPKPSSTLDARDRRQGRSKRGRGRRAGSAVLVLATTLGLLTAVAASSCRSEEVPEQAAQLGATLELAAGEVLLVDEDGERSRLLSHTPLPIGARVETGAGSRALIHLGDGTRVLMKDQSALVLGEGLSLEKGQVWLDAPALERGQDATLHQLGGDIQVAVSDGGASLTRTKDGAEVYVAEGLAIVSAAKGRTEVEPGERATIRAGVPSVEPEKFWQDWTGGMADYGGARAESWVGTGSLYAINHQALPGAQAQPLSIQRQRVEVAIDDMIAETEVDQVFFNPAGSEVEGYYWFTVPEDAMIVGFALEVDGELVDAEVVERKQAASTYEGYIPQRVDPALLEWIDGRTVRARIFPIPAAGTRRVVIRYQQLLRESEGKLRYTYPMAAPVGRDAATIEEFALEVQLRGELAKRYSPATRAEARVEGRDKDRISMRRSGYSPRSDFELELERRHDSPEAGPGRDPLRVDLLDPGGDQADYVMVRWRPDETLKLDEAPVPKGELVVVVDTSGGSDPGEHQAKLAVTEALLRSLSAKDQFALVSADLDAEVLYPAEEGLSEATAEAIAEAIEALSARGAGGASDLTAPLEVALGRVHGSTQPAVVYVGDGLASTGTIDGDAIADELRQAMSGSPARLFTVAVGREVDDALLTRLARIGGGRSLRVEDPREAVLEALDLAGALKTPTLTDLEIDLGEGLDHELHSGTGKLSRGEELLVLARTHHELPDAITVRGSFAGEEFNQVYERDARGEDQLGYRIRREGVVARVLPRLWARAYIDETLLDARGPAEVRGKVLGLGYDYGLMTPFTSFLALESEDAYDRAGIERLRREFPILTADASGLRAPEPADTSADVSVLSMILGAGAAPFGCGVEPPPEQLRPPEPEDEAASYGEDRRARTRGPVPSAAPAPGRFDQHFAPDQSGEGLRWEPGLGPGRAADPDEGEGRRVRGVFRLPSVAEQAAEERKRRLEAAGILAPAPPPWVDETTEAELIRRSMFGKARTESSPVARDQQQTCSDASTRGLAARRLMWQRRLDRAASMTAMLQLYEGARASCEIRRWRDQRAFLDLLQVRARTEAELRLLLGHFAPQPDAQNYLAQALLRRLIDPALVATVVYAQHGPTDWWDVDRQLSVTDDPRERLAILDRALRNAEGDPDGERRIIREFARQDRVKEAIKRGMSLRDKGMLTPELIQVVGELLAEAGREAEAKRLFSELVEYAPRSVANRRLLGDLFLRHGWYDDAYTQYKLLFELQPTPLAAIRLARAYAGRGYGQQARDVLARVQAGEGRPGVDDPRRWARLHTAVILADSLESVEDKNREAVKSDLRALNLFEGAGTWELLIWDDLGADLVLVPDYADANAPRQFASDDVDAAGTGLYARQSTGAGAELIVRHAGLVPDRDVPWRRVTLRWDGEDFAVEEREGTIVARQAKAKAEEPEAEADATNDDAEGSEGADAPAEDPEPGQD